MPYCGSSALGVNTTQLNTGPVYLVSLKLINISSQLVFYLALYLVSEFQYSLSL